MGPKLKLEYFSNIVGVLTNFRHYRLGVDNLDKLVMIMKKWSIDAKLDCPQER